MGAIGEPAPEKPSDEQRRASIFHAALAWSEAKPRTAAEIEAAHAALHRHVDRHATEPTSNLPTNPDGSAAWFGGEVFAAIRRTRRQRRQERDRLRAAAEALSRPTEAADPAVLAVMRETEETFRGVVRALPSDERTAFIGRVWRREPPARTAQRLFGVDHAEAIRAVHRLAKSATLRFRDAIEARYGSPEVAWEALCVAVGYCLDYRPEDAAPEAEPRENRDEGDPGLR